MEVVTEFFDLIFCTKMLHWQTFSYSQHKATDMFSEELENKVDEFVEIYQGIFGRIKVPSRTSLTLENMTLKKYVKKLNHLLSFLQQWTPLHSHETPPLQGLMNVRDEIIGLVQQTKFLLTQH